MGNFFERAWKTVVSIASVVVSILAPPLAPAMWAVNMAISGYTAIQSGNVLGFLGGIAGGAVFGAIGQSLGGAISATMTNVGTFTSGFIVGAVEFGISGFGAGFVGALSGGASFSEAIKAGGIGAAAGAVAGGIIQGSYHAGWQKSMHGYDDPRIAARNAQDALNTNKAPGLFEKVKNKLKEVGRNILEELAFQDPTSGTVEAYLKSRIAIEQNERFINEYMYMKYGFDDPSIIQPGYSLEQWEAQQYMLQRQLEIMEHKAKQLNN